ncbi:MAG: hypothetical protein IJ068_01335 [Bacilli bacterium]|nr:hypothetical protein [Bacilli bacterium]
MLNNISTTDDSIYYLGDRPRNGARLVKLSNPGSFKAKTTKLQEEYRSSHPVEENNVEVSSAQETPVASNSEVDQQVESKEADEPNDNILPFTSKEVLLSKKDSLGIEAYQDVESNIVNLQDYQNARRLRVNEVVVGNANRTRNVLGTVRANVESNTEVSQEPFDFSNVVASNQTDAASEAEVKYDNDTKLDQWLNKENGTQSINTNDAMLNEVNELQNKRNDNANSLATQKEILEALRARIATNEELCRQRKQQLEEENLQLTQELNDVLAEINQLTSLANEQEAFLGISDEEVGKSKAA